MPDEWDCVVVGGGAAGLSAALVLGRARRRVLVIDVGEPSNRAAPAIGGMLGHDQRSPAEFYEAGRREVEAYPGVEYRKGRVVAGKPVDDRFELELDDDESVTANRVLLATGMQYRPPELPGIDKLWGVTVFQCPFCHGWEMRDKRLAALCAGDNALDAALMLRGWSDDVTLLTDGPPNLDDDDRRKLQAAKVAVEERRIVELLGDESQLSAIVFADGTHLERDGLLVDAPLHQRSRLAEELGVALTDGPLGPDSVKVDSLHRTSVPGIFAVGDVCTEQPYIASAIADGSQAAKIIVQSLLADEFGLPYPPGSDD